MSIRRFAAVLAAASVFAGPALATTPPSTPAPATPPATTPASTKVTGSVKAWNAQTHQLTVTVNGKDQVFDTGTLTLDPAIKVGATVDVTATGNKATVVTPHKQ
jgi:hypothetical protein